MKKILSVIVMATLLSACGTRAGETEGKVTYTTDSQPSYFQSNQIATSEKQSSAEYEAFIKQFDELTNVFDNADAVHKTSEEIKALSEEQREEIKKTLDDFSLKLEEMEKKIEEFKSYYSTEKYNELCEIAKKYRLEIEKKKEEMKK